MDGNVVAAGRLALVAVGGAAQRGGRVAVLPGSRLDDGLLDVCAIAVSGADEFVPIMAKALSGDHLGEPGVTWARGRRVVLRSDDGPLPFEHDGELWEGNERRLELGVVPAAVPAAVPATGAVARN